MRKLIGTGVALITPFDENKAIDWKGLAGVLEHTYAEGKGVEYWVIQGTTGESPTTTPEEKNDILAFVKDNNKGKLPIVYGIGGNDTKQILEAIKITNFSGVDALLSVSPYYNKPSQKGLLTHYEAIADASPVPVVLYNVPGRTASNIQAETTLALAEHDNIIATKEAAGDLRQCMEIVRHKPKDFLLLSGDDMLSIPMISIGGQGTISVLANAFPVLFANKIRFALEGNFIKAQYILNQLLAIDPLMYTESNPVGVKQALAAQGVCTNEVRLPLLSASEELQAKIRNTIEGLDSNSS